MRTRQVLGCKALLVVLALTLMVTACSRMNLAYRNLHLLIPWTLDDYLNLNRDQQQRFRTQLREHLRWHCRTQLPSYLVDIEQLQTQVRQGTVDDTTLRTGYARARQAIHAIAVEITPTLTQLLADLDETQVREFNEALADDRRQKQEEYLKPPLDQQIREREERMGERVEHWLGRVSPAQRQRILTWSFALGAQNQRWLDNRARWQQMLSDALADRQGAGFERRITELLQAPETLWSADYRAAFDRAEQLTIDLVRDLYELSDAGQRDHFMAQLEDLRKDLGSLDCLPEPD
ncbi:DUF6279 family lipoprotein [Stutzerimonas stutzeri]|uniref:DUF6279 family lipoprotein n=1 Tax=Stutzerimonas stutzeri TaxID=316 RepID=UPI001C2ED6D5|nr:DUF6279 family lipoprotein [Stutzerimonas stutzeri]